MPRQCAHWLAMTVFLGRCGAWTAAGCGHPALRITRSTCGRGVGDAAPYGGKARGAADDERDDVGIAPYGGCGGAVRGRAAAHMGAALQGITGGAVQVGGVEPRPYAGQGVRCGGRTDCHASVRTGSQ